MIDTADARVPIDVNEMRDSAILLNGLEHADTPYCLFYDETNNIRRLHLEDGALNVPTLGCWVLGGVGRRDGAPIDLTQLRDRARIQSNAKEVKFHHFGKGDFLTVLGSRKLEVFLDWVIEEGLLIHYLALDPFYWSIVDIIDSSLAEDAGVLVAFAPQLKSDLYAVLRADRRRATELMSRFGYPNIGPDHRSAFMSGLLEHLRDEEDRLEPFAYQMVRGLLQMARDKSLSHLEDEKPRVLIDSFKSFFLERICLLKQASHVFDAEDVVAAKLDEIDLRDGTAPFCNYRFVARSHDEPGVQASDVVVGLIGKFFTWIGDSSPATVAWTRANLSPAQARNRERLARLFEATNTENAALTMIVVSLEDQHKAGHFLEL